jgi:hypothetical protein
LHAPALNTLRYEYLIALATKAEEMGGYGYSYEAQKWLQLAAVYREMAAAYYTPESAGTRKLNADKRAELIEKLRAMTVRNGCTEEEADTALQMRLRLERDDVA